MYTLSKNNKFLGLLLLSLIPLFALSQDLDSIKCYKKSELKVIALTLISGKECDALLKVANDTNLEKDSLIQSKNTIIVIKDHEFNLEHTITLKQDTTINIQKKQLKKAANKLKWVKAGWASTTLGLLLLVIMVVLRH